MNLDSKEKILNDWNKYWIDKLGVENVDETTHSESYDALRRKILYYCKSFGSKEKMDEIKTVDRYIGPEKGKRIKNDSHQIFINFLNRMKAINKKNKPKEN